MNHSRQNPPGAQTAPIVALISGAILLAGAPPETARAQSLLDESGTSTLAPSLTPVGGYGANPQEYLQVSWSVVENPSGIYFYSYTVNNPAGDVLLSPAGGLTSTPEIFDTFSVDFDTTKPGEYLPGSVSGGALQEVNAIDIAWFFNPSIPAGSSAPTVSFQSDFPPTSGNANAEDASPPSPWSSLSLNGQQVAVPDAPAAVPEPAPLALFAVAGLLFLPAVVVRRKKSGPAK